MLATSLKKLSQSATIVTFGIAIFAAVGNAPANAAKLVFKANLSGSAEAPANPSPGTGTAFVTLDDIANTMRVKVDFGGLLGNVTASHIHSATAIPGTGTAGVATPTPSFPGFPSGVKSGTYDQLFDMTLASSYRAGFITANGGSTSTAQTALFDGIKSGKAYLNIHTATYPGGEIRGFFAPAVPEPMTITGTVVAGAMGLWMKRKQKASKVA